MLSEKFIRFDTKYRTYRSKIVEVLELIRRRHSLFRKQLDTMNNQMAEWRISRRLWELDLVKREFTTGNLVIFKPGFTNADITAAETYVKEQNQLDKERKTHTWFVGSHPNVDKKDMTLAQHWMRTGHCSVVVLSEMEKLKNIENTLRRQIQDIDSANETLVIDLTSNRQEDTSTREDDPVPTGNDNELAWKIERHVNWALPAIKKQITTRRDAELVFQTAFAGKSSLHQNMIRIPKKTMTRPWGTPAYHINKLLPSDKKGWMFSQEGRKILLSLENWYFQLPNLSKIADLDFKNWNFDDESDLKKFYDDWFT
jgi:hypothetical protein